MNFEVNNDILSSETLICEVHDENSSRGDSFLGRGSFPLRKLCDDGNFKKIVPASVDLHLDSGVARGRLELQLCLQPGVLASSKSAIPVESIKLTHGVLQIKKIEVDGLNSISSKSKVRFFYCFYGNQFYTVSNFTKHLYITVLREIGIVACD